MWRDVLPALPWSVNRDNNVVAGLHPGTPLHVSNQYTLSLSVSCFITMCAHPCLRRSFVGRGIPSSCDVMKSHRRMVRGWGMINIAVVPVDFPIYTSTLNLTLERWPINMASSIVLLYVDIYTDNKNNCYSCRNSWYSVLIDCVSFFIQEMLSNYYTNLHRFYITQSFIDFETAFDKNLHFSDRIRI